MKKCLLISSLIHILILLIPFSKNPEKVEEIQEIRIRNVIFQEKRVETIESFRPSSLENQNFESSKTNVEKNLKTFQENLNNNGTSEKKFSENFVQLVYEKENSIDNEQRIENSKLENQSLREEKSEEVFEKNDFSKESLNTNDNNQELYIKNTESIFVKDDNILANGLIKENNQLVYKILREVKPEYPAKAKNLNFRGKIVVTSEFIVGKDGRVREIRLKSENDLYKKYSFNKSIEKALREFRFTPISYKGNIVEVVFSKEFEFN